MIDRNGGSNTTAIAAGVASNTLVKGGYARLCTILVTTTGTNSLTIYDSSSATSGTIIGALPVSPAVGTILRLQMPAINGILVAGNAANPAVTIAWE